MSSSPPPILPPLKLPHFISPDICDALRKASENSTFIPDTNTSYEQKTDDIEIIKSSTLRSLLLHHSLIPSITAALQTYSSSPLTSFNDIFIVRYSSLQVKLKKHVDGGDISFMCALSDSESYVGGGTKFEGVEEVMHLEKGSCVVFDASIYHEGLPITAGTRYLLVAFCYTSILSTRIPNHITLDLRESKGNRNRFELGKVERFRIERLKGVGKRLAKLGKSVWVPFVEEEGEKFSLLTKFARRIAKLHLNRLGLGFTKTGGCEIWAQRLSSSSSIPFHLDKDENHAKLHPTLPTKHPLISTVTYLKKSERSTIIFGENNILISKSEAGKHVAFSGEYIHGVEEGGRKRKREGKRLTVLVNVWLKKIIVDGFAEFEELGDDDDFEEDINNMNLELASWTEIESGLTPPTLKTGRIEEVNDILNVIKPKIKNVKGSILLV